VGGGEAIDGEWGAGGLREMEEAGDVIVLVVAGEKALSFGVGEGEGGEGDGSAEVACGGQVAIDEFAERHHGSAASGFGGHGSIVR